MGGNAARCYMISWGCNIGYITPHPASSDIKSRTDLNIKMILIRSRLIKPTRHTGESLHSMAGYTADFSKKFIYSEIVYGLSVEILIPMCMNFL